MITEDEFSVESANGSRVTFFGSAVRKLLSFPSNWQRKTKQSTTRSRDHEVGTERRRSLLPSDRHCLRDGCRCKYGELTNWRNWQKVMCHWAALAFFACEVWTFYRHMAYFNPICRIIVTGKLVLRDSANVTLNDASVCLPQALFNNLVMTENFEIFSCDETETYLYWITHFRLFWNRACLSQSRVNYSLYELSQ